MHATLALMAAALAEGLRVSRRVAVVGGGSAGVAAARFLKQAGHKPNIFETGASFGGVWAEQPTNNVVYKNLRTNLPKQVMQSPDLDFPASLPSYVDGRALGDYISTYAEKFGVQATFGARVLDVTPLPGDRWQVKYETQQGCSTDEYDAVVVCNGHYEAPYIPEIPGQDEWLIGDRSIEHSLHYDVPEPYEGKSVLIVGGRSSGVDISRELQNVAQWTYIIEKKCSDLVSDSQKRVTHVPLGASLHEDGHLYFESTKAPGPPIDRVILATGYVYAFPFLKEDEVGMEFEGRRSCRPLYLHLQHAERPTLGFVGIQLAVPCPIPTFEAQSRYLGEAWATREGALTPLGERQSWVAQRLATVEASGREQDLHYTTAEGSSAWAYIRELVNAAPPPPVRSWLDSEEFDARLSTVEGIYRDRGARYPTKPWHDDSYRRCEYSVDWERGEWDVAC
jgi:thioredoxin reductase